MGARSGRRNHGNEWRSRISENRKYIYIYAEREGWSVSNPIRQHGDTPHKQGRQIDRYMKQEVEARSERERNINNKIK